MFKYYQFCFCFGFFILLSGCFHYEQNFSINLDGEVNYTEFSSIEGSVVGMLLEDKTEVEICAGEAEYKIPEKIKVKEENYYEDGNLICNAQYQGNIDEFLRLKTYSLVDNTEQNSLIVTKLSDGRYKLESKITTTIPENESEEDKALRQMMTGMMGEAKWVWKVNVNNVVETNGRRKEDGSIYWELPMGVAFAPGERQFYVIFEK